ncbi:hypothetical protein ACIQOU_04630 [Streptomyces sp. NPDC091279]|uniref:hypothetical protein n=1 Tax=Streptomyces sp. NPDC091279 TaxID=3365983 RepID=UPI00381D35E3
MWTRVKEHYRPLPESLIVGDVFLRCSSCGLPALPRGRTVPVPPVSGTGVWCEGEECPRGERMEMIRDPDHAWVLRRSLRVFLALPHRVEEAALDELDHAGIDYEAVSGHLCGYRLRNTGPETLDIQVYDRLQPGLLAAHVTDTMLSADFTFIVVPQRLARRDNYHATFTAALPALFRERVALTSPEDLVHRFGASPADRDDAGTAHHRDLGPTRGEEKDDA